MYAEKIKQIIKKLEAVLPQKDTESPECVIDAETVLDVLEILDDLPFQCRLLDATTKRCEQLNSIGVDVWRSGNKGRAYREAAKKLKWTGDRRSIESRKIFIEYLDLIGAAIAAHLHTTEEIIELTRDRKPLPKRMGKSEAIKFLTEKYKIQSYDATYERLKRARANCIREAGVDKQDCSYLDRILPSTWGQEATGEKTDCLFYDKCFEIAFNAEVTMDCNLCKKFKPII